MPSLLELYDSFPREIFRADFIRPLYLFFQGGLYADLDFQCLQRLDRIFSPPELNLLLGRMGTDHNFAHSVPNAFMASSAHECFWLGYLAAMEAAWNIRKHQENITSQPEQITGPVVLREVVNLYKSQPDRFKNIVNNFIQRHDLKINQDALKISKLVVLPGHILYPINWNDKIHQAFRTSVLEKKKIFSIAEARVLFPASLAVTYWSHSW